MKVFKSIATWNRFDTKNIQNLYRQSLDGFAEKVQKLHDYFIKEGFDEKVYSSALVKYSDRGLTWGLNTRILAPSTRRHLYGCNRRKRHG